MVAENQDSEINNGFTIPLSAKLAVTTMKALLYALYRDKMLYFIDKKCKDIILTTNMLQNMQN